jgi:hypothetical protein
VAECKWPKVLHIWVLPRRDLQIWVPSEMACFCEASFVLGSSLKLQLTFGGGHPSHECNKNCKHTSNKKSSDENEKTRMRHPLGTRHGGRLSRQAEASRLHTHRWGRRAATSPHKDSHKGPRCISFSPPLPSLSPCLPKGPTCSRPGLRFQNTRSKSLPQASQHNVFVNLAASSKHQHFETKNKKTTKNMTHKKRCCNVALVSRWRKRWPNAKPIMFYT